MFYVALLFSSLFALILLSPFRAFALSIGSLATIPATLVLFFLPGIVLTGLLLRSSGRDLGLPSTVPVAFAMSVGIFGILAVPPLVLQWSFRTYLIICGAVLAISLLGALFLALRGRGVAANEPHERPERGAWLLWVPLAVLTAVLTATSLNVTTLFGPDAWAYMIYVRDYMSAEQLNAGSAGFSRTTFSGWLLEQAALSRISGTDPVPLLARYLGPGLVVVSVLAFYGLARTLFRDSRAALLAGFLAAVFFLTHMTSQTSSGTEFVARITEDKFVARFVFLPVALNLAVLFVRSRRLAYLGLFTLVCWSVVSVHYIGFAMIGASLTGFGLVSVILHPRDRASWVSFGALGGVILAAGLPAFAYVLVRGASFLSQLETTSPESTAVQIYTAQKIEHLLVLGEGSYIMHPALILDPFIMVALILGVPFLIYHARQSLAARMLLGTLLFTAILVYFPPVATFIAGIIGPWTLWRVAWPIELAALLTLGWVAWSALAFAAGHLERTGRGRRLAPVLPLLFVAVLSAAFLVPIANGVRAASGTGETAQNATTCEDPVFPWMSGVVTRQTAIFSQDPEQQCVIAYVDSAWIFSFRSNTYELGQTLLEKESDKKQELPQAVADQQEFFDARVIDEEMINILNRNGSGYVLLSSSSPLNDQLRHVPGFEALDNPGSRYRFFEMEPRNVEQTPAVAMNGRLAEEDWEEALAVYPDVLQGDKDEQFLAHLGAGLAYGELDQPDRAAESYERALSLFPDSPTVYPLLAEAYRETGDRRAAREILEKAVDRYPKNVDLRFELASQLTNSGTDDEALKQYQAIVKAFPDVPVYRTRLGGALLEAGKPKVAAEEFERAIDLNPYSTGTHLKIGQSNEAAGRYEEAVEAYEKAIRMGLDSQLIRLKLGQVHTTLAKPGRKENFEHAEENLTEAAEMGSFDPSKDLSDRAYVALGDLYRRWKRPEDAKTAYKEALRINPDFGPASKKLERLRGRSE